MRIKDILWCIFGFPIMWVAIMFYAIYAIPVMILMAIMAKGNESLQPED